MALGSVALAQPVGQVDGGPQHPLVPQHQVLVQGKAHQQAQGLGVAAGDRILARVTGVEQLQQSALVALEDLALLGQGDLILVDIGEEAVQILQQVPLRRQGRQVAVVDADPALHLVGQGRCQHHQEVGGDEEHLPVVAGGNVDQPAVLQLDQRDGGGLAPAPGHQVDDLLAQFHRDAVLAAGVGDHLERGPLLLAQSAQGLADARRGQQMLSQGGFRRLAVGARRQSRQVNHAG